MVLRFHSSDSSRELAAGSLNMDISDCLVRGADNLKCDITSTLEETLNL